MSWLKKFTKPPVAILSIEPVQRLHAVAYAEICEGGVLEPKKRLL